MNMKNNFLNELNTLTNFILKNKVDNKRNRHLQKCWKNFTKKINAQPGQTIQEQVKAVDSAFTELQKLAQALCLASEVYYPHDHTMPKLHYWAEGLNKKVQEAKNSFLTEYVIRAATRQGGAVYSTTTIPKGSFYDKTA